MKKLLTVREAAAILRVSPFTVRAEVHRGKLACVRVGRRMMIDPDDLKAYRKAQRETKKPYPMAVRAKTMLTGRGI